MRKPTRRWLGIVGALFVFGAQAAPPAAENPAPFLWQVDGPKARHYLLGSVHMLPEAAYPLPVALESAYEATRGIVFESDLGAMSSPDLQGRLIGAAKEDRPGGLKGAIGKTLYAKLQKHATRLGMPTPACEGVRAWFCAMMLELYPMQLAGYQAELGIDQHFYAKAIEDGRNASWFETPEQQLNLFIEMPDALATKFLAATLDDLTEDSMGPDQLLKAWRSGDHAAMEKLVKDLRARYPDVYARLIGDRNRAWLPKLVERLSGAEPQLIIVGSAHFEGPDGLVALLKSQNLVATPVTGPIAQVAAAPAAKEARDPRAPELPWLAPQLPARDVEAAAAFYQKAFGFEAATLVRADDGKLRQGQLRYHEAAIVLVPEDPNLQRLAPVSAKITPSAQLLVYVDDVDALLARARSAGAEVVRGPLEQPSGDRTVTLRDPEGYVWVFATHTGGALPGPH